MLQQIKLRYSNTSLAHDDSVSECTIRSNCPNFFNCKHGKRETYTFYRGCIIVRNTVQFTGCPPERKTTVYLYFPESPDTLHLCWSKDVRDAKRTIDRVLEAGDMAAVEKGS